MARADVGVDLVAHEGSALVTVILWRCATCGKWSHAKRRPRHHQRFIPSGEALPAGAKVLRDEPAEYDHLNGFSSDGGTWIACGPHEPWKATPVNGEQLALPLDDPNRQPWRAER